MSAWTPDWKLIVGGVDYTDIAISDIRHEAGRTDIYSQPNPSYIQITLIALNNQTLPFDINDSLDLQVKDSSASYVSIFGGDITDVSVEVGATGSVSTVVQYTILAMGSLARIAREIWNDNISQDEDGNQIYEILSSVLLGTWNDVPAATTWATYNATETWENAVNLGLGDIDQPGLYTMTAQSNLTDTIYNVVSDIANSAFGYIYEDNAGNIGYADADHRQNYLLTNGYVDLDAGHALGAGLSTVMRSGDVRNDIYINYGNNFNSQETATDLASIALYGYKAETINSRIQGSVDAQAIADRYIAQRAYPLPKFQSHHTKLLYVWRWSRFLGLLKLQITTTQLKTLSPMVLSIGQFSKQSKTKILNGRNNV